MTIKRQLPIVVKREGFWDATCPKCHEYRADAGKREMFQWVKLHRCTENVEVSAFATLADLANHREGLS